MSFSKQSFEAIFFQQTTLKKRGQADQAAAALQAASTLVNPGPWSAQFDYKSPLQGPTKGVFFLSKRLATLDHQFEHWFRFFLVLLIFFNRLSIDKRTLLSSSELRETASSRLQLRTDRMTESFKATRIKRETSFWSSSNFEVEKSGALLGEHQSKLSRTTRDPPPSRLAAGPKRHYHVNIDQWAIVRPIIQTR